MLLSRLFRTVPTFLLLVAAPALAVGDALPPPPTPQAPSFNVKSYVLQDVHSGRVVASFNPDKRVAPASLTKLMTLYITFSELKKDQIHLDDKVQIGKQAWSTGGSRMFLPLGAHVTVRKLIQGVIVDSGNDAAMSLASYIGGSIPTFAGYMNRYAKQLGMKGSHFVNPTGLPNSDHYVTAVDMARLTSALIRNFPDYYHFFAERKMTFNKITQRNRNGLLWTDPSVDGLKTGHTESAGYNLIASGVRGGDRLVSVVIGADSTKDREKDCDALLNYGFRFFTTKRLYAANTAVTSVHVWKGAKDDVKVGLGNPLYVTVPQAEVSALKAEEDIQGRVIAPVRVGQTLGQLKVSMQGKTVAQAPLRALDNVALGGWLTRISDDASLFFRRHFPSLAVN